MGKNQTPRMNRRTGRGFNSTRRVSGYTLHWKLWGYIYYRRKRHFKHVQALDSKIILFQGLQVQDVVPHFPDDSLAA